MLGDEGFASQAFCETHILKARGGRDDAHIRLETATPSQARMERTHRLKVSQADARNVPLIAARLVEALCSTSAGMDALKTTGVKSKVSNGQSPVLRKARDAVGCGAEGWAQAVEHLSACGVFASLAARGSYKLVQTLPVLDAFLSKGACRSCLTGML